MMRFPLQSIQRHGRQLWLLVVVLGLCVLLQPALSARAATLGTTEQDPDARALVTFLFALALPQPNWATNLTTAWQHGRFAVDPTTSLQFAGVTDQPADAPRSLGSRTIGL